MHVKVKVEGGDVQKAVEKVREVVASTGGKIGGVAAGRKEVTKGASERSLSVFRISIDR